MCVAPICRLWSVCFQWVGTPGEAKQFLCVLLRCMRVCRGGENNELHFISKFVGLCCVLVFQTSLLFCPRNACLMFGSTVRIYQQCWAHSTSRKCKDQSMSNLNKWLVCFYTIFICTGININHSGSHLLSSCQSGVNIEQISMFKTFGNVQASPWTMTRGYMSNFFNNTSLNIPLLIILSAMPRPFWTLQAECTPVPYLWNVKWFRIVPS